jgi:hypothetical protein
MPRAARFSIGVVVVLALAGCSTLQGREADGIYTSPDGEFSVAVPQVLDVAATDGAVGASKRFVDFATGGVYWTAEGGYSVEWYKLDKPYTSDDKFYSDTAEFLPKMVKAEFGADFTVLQANAIKVNGRSAYQVIARGTKDHADAFWVCTAVDFDNRIGLVMLMVPVQHDANSHGAATPAAALAWPRYPGFVDSLKDNVPYP